MGKKAAKEINKSNAFISSYQWKNGALIQLEGEKITPAQLKAFTSLTDLHLDIYSRAWKKADFSKFKKLNKLYLHNPIYTQKVNISKNPELTDLTISNIKIGKTSALKKLDLSKNGNLKHLELQKLPISKLGLSNNTELQALALFEIHVDLDFSKLKKLQELSMRYNHKISTLSFKLKNKI